MSKKKVRKKTIKNAKGVEIPAPKKVGRPTDYCPSFCEVVIEEMSKGYSKEASAGYIGVSKQTFYRWMEEHVEFRDAVHIGEVKSQRTWENKAVDFAVHTKDGKRLDSRIYALQMKNRFDWSDKKEIKVEEENKAVKSFSFNFVEAPEDLDKRGGDNVE